MTPHLEDSLRLGVALISILNPLGIIPSFLALTESFSDDKVQKIATSCALSVMVTLAVSLVIGRNILSFFGISIASFAIGGGILIFTMAFQMMSGSNHSSKMSEKEKRIIDPSEVGIVPLAIPLLAGPGTISTTIIHSQELTSYLHWIGAAIVIILLGLIVKLVLSFSKKIGAKMGRIGLNVMTRIMGLILMAISIEMILGGLKQILPALKG